jgi:hypothetical protein
MDNDELEPVTDNRMKAGLLVHELREVADMIERCPELMETPNPYDAAQVMLMDLDSLDSPDGLDALDPDTDE